MLSWYGFGFEEDDGFDDGWGIGSLNPNSEGRLVQSSPLYLIEAGLVRVPIGFADNMLNYGLLWTSTASRDSSLQAYYMHYNDTTVNPAVNFDRWHGASLRLALCGLERETVVTIPREELTCL